MKERERERGREKGKGGGKWEKRGERSLWKGVYTYISQGNI